MGDDASNYNRYDLTITSLNEAFVWQKIFLRGDITLIHLAVMMMMMMITVV